MQLRDAPAARAPKAGSNGAAVSLPGIPAARALAGRSVFAPARDLAILLAAAVTVLAYENELRVGDLAWSVLAGVLTVATLHARGAYRFRFRTGMLEETGDLVLSVGLAVLLTLGAQSVVHATDLGTGEALVLGSGSFLALLATRAHAELRRRRALRGEHGGAPTLIVGAGSVGQLIARRLQDRREFGLRPIGFLDPDESFDGHGADGVPVLGAGVDLEPVVHAHGVRHVIVTFPTDVPLQLVQRCRRLGVVVSIVPQCFEHFTGRIEIEHLGAVAVVHPGGPDPQGWQFGLKYALDRLFAFMLLVATLPILGGVALLVKLSSPGPVLFRQRRVGRDGQSFELLKFRSMRNEEPTTPFELLAGLAPGGVEGTDRRTPIGRFLRRTAIDELPQLFNVLKGDMSLIGPRPERPEFAETFGRDFARYTDRHRVRSGMTGWAQVNGLRGQTSLRDRIEWDNYYIENWSLAFDLKILLLTVGAVLSSRDDA